MTGDDDRAAGAHGRAAGFLHACADAAVGALLALTERAASGRGQHVEVSAQRSMTAGDAELRRSPSPLGGDAGAADERRRQDRRRSTSSCVWPCKDGFVSITFLFGASIGPFTRRLMEWIHEEGFCDEATRDKDWIDYANQLYDGREPIAEYERLKAIIGEFCATQTKAELLEAAQRRGCC